MGKLQGRASRALTLYVRQLAWLHAVPRPPADTPRAKTFDLTKALSRLAEQKKQGVDPSMPPCPLPHMIERLTEIGLTSSNGMGTVPLSWAEIAAWQTNTHIALSPWEARLIRALSAAYVAESRSAEEEGCPSPWAEAGKAAEIAILDAVLG